MFTLARRSSAEPRRGRRVGVQPERLADVRQLADAGRPGQQVVPGVPRAVRPLSEHIHRQPARRPHTVLERRARRPGGPERGAHQLRQGMGSQVFPAGDHGLSHVDRSAVGPLQMTQGRRRRRPRPPDVFWTLAVFGRTEILNNRCYNLHI